MADRRPVDVEVYVRSLASRGADQQQRHVLDRLAAVANDISAVSLSVTVWGGRLPLDGPAAETDAGQEIRETVVRFKTWAARTDATLSPCFDECVVEPLDGDPIRVCSLPRLCVAVSVDGTLEQVYPHRRDGLTFGVDDCLARFAAMQSSRADRTDTVSSTSLPGVEPR